MAPRSYCQQILPDEFVDVAFSFTALHWLQKMPKDCYDAIKPSILAASAQNDLTTFLTARHSELKRNGNLIIGVPAKGSVGIGPVLRCLETVIGRLSSTYLIKPSFVAQMPLYFRTMDEMTAAIKAAKEWRIVDNFTAPMEHPSWKLATLERNNNSSETSVAEKYADSITGFAMAALTGTFLNEVRRLYQRDHITDEQEGKVDVEFVRDLKSEFRQEFIRSHSHEVVGFTYTFLQLEKQ